MSALEAIEVLLINGKKVRVVLDASVGVFGIHQIVWGEKDVGPGWSISHSNTGTLIWSVQNFDEALKVAEFLNKKRTIPEGKEAFLAWSEKLSASEKTNLTAQLQTIAPRYHPYPVG